MLLTRTILRRFFLYLGAGGSLLVLIHRLVDGAEKIVGAPATTRLATLGNFLVSTMIPAFFDLLPLTAWLALCLLLREWHAGCMLESLCCTGISRQRIMALFALAGMLVSVVRLGGTYILVPTLHEHTHQLKSQLRAASKRGTPKLSWRAHRDQTFLCTHSSRNKTDRIPYSPALIIRCDERYRPLTITHLHANRRQSSNQNAEEKLCGREYDVQSGRRRILPAEEIQRVTEHINSSPLHKTSEVSVNTSTLHALILALQPLILIGLGSALWLSPLGNTRQRWLALLALYPIMVALNTSMSTLISWGAPTILYTLPALLALGGWLLLYSWRTH